MYFAESGDILSAVLIDKKKMTLLIMPGIPHCIVYYFGYVHSSVAYQ